MQKIYWTDRLPVFYISIYVLQLMWKYAEEYHASWYEHGL